MTATKPPNPSPTLDGFAAQLVGGPLAGSPRGGMETGFTGTTQGGAGTSGDQQASPEYANQGPVLSLPDAECFKHVDGLVRRQEILAKNRLAQDNYYTCVVSGYPWATLTHDTQRDVWEFSLPYGANSVSIQAVPNKNLDLVNKAASGLLADFPEPDAEPIDDSEEAEEAADLANRFLAENASEQGTNDSVLWEDRLKRALVTASAFVEGWVDPTGGGYIPLQIKAHPQAVDPQNALVGPDGSVTTDYVLRYVTAPPDQGGQFTDDASQAAPQWQPKIVASRWERQHVRTYPEDKPVSDAQKVIVLGYCTISEGRRRWPDTVGAMQADDLTALCDWTPIRFQSLLPAFQRARWKLTDGREKERASSSDERIFFYYHNYDRPSLDYPRGSDVVVTGAKGGLVLGRATLASPVTVKKGQQQTSEIRCRDIPVVQLTPRLDPNGRDPMGLSYLEAFVGATENTAHLAMGFAEGLDKVLHTPFAVPSTSPIDGDQVENARATGDMLTVLSKDDMPQQLQPPVLPSSFFEMFSLADEATNSIAAQERAAQGADTSKERSGKALQIAVSRNTVNNGPQQTAFNNAVARWNRIKLELAMASYETPQLVRYVGEDGAYKQTEFTGVDFALVGKVSTKAGTGTGYPPDQKVQYLGQLRANGMMTDDEVLEAARPIFSKTMGLPPDPHEQYVERCLEAWRKGPPTPDWEQQYATWQHAQVAYEQQQQQYQAALQRFQQAQEIAAVVQAGPPNPTLGPEGQNAQSALQYSQAVIAQRFNPLPAMMPQPPQAPQVPKPWSPFAPRPNDTEPKLANIWLRKLSRAMSSVEYEHASPGWRDDFTRQYTRCRQAAAIASGAQQPQSTPATAPPRAQSATPREAQTGAQHPQSPSQAPRSAA